MMHILNESSLLLNIITEDETPQKKLVSKGCHQNQSPLSRDSVKQARLTLCTKGLH